MLLLGVDDGQLLQQEDADEADQHGDHQDAHLDRFALGHLRHFGDQIEEGDADQQPGGEGHDVEQILAVSEGEQAAGQGHEERSKSVDGGHRGSLAAFGVWGPALAGRLKPARTPSGRSYAAPRRGFPSEHSMAEETRSSMSKGLRMRPQIREVSRLSTARWLAPVITITRGRSDGLSRIRRSSSSKPLTSGIIRSRRMTE